MDIVIRTDASIEIGSGHVMRCLTVATELKKNGHEIYFWMETLQGDMTELVKSKGFNLISEVQKADIYIIDHYKIGSAWERKIRPHTSKIVVIDDLADREHDCDLLIDSSFVPHYERRYDNLVPEYCQKLLGPNYLIIREEFIKQRKKLRERNGELNRLLIFMGGSDPTNETMKVLKALENTQVSFVVDVVVGINNPQKKEINTICKMKGYQFHCQIDYISKLMAEADFSIGAGGSATWERCFLGLPSSSTIVAKNQQIGTEAIAEIGAVWNLGCHEKVLVNTYSEVLNSLVSKQNELSMMSKIGLELTNQLSVENLWLKSILEV